MLKKSFIAIKILCVFFAISVSSLFLGCSSRANNKSVYEIYKQAHPDYIGSEEEWLDDLINGCLATDEKKFIVGEEIFFEDGKEFNLPLNTYIFGTGTITEQCRITAKMVAMEEYTLEDSTNWPYEDQYTFSYRYRIYVKGYCSKDHAGETISHTLTFRTSPYNGVTYLSTANYEGTIISDDGYFEFSVDVYMPDIITKVIPVSLYK